MGKKLRTTVTAGYCTELIEYTPVHATRSNRERVAKSQISSEARKRKNAALSRKNLKFKLSANFKPRKDYFATLTFADVSKINSRSDVERTMKKFLRRLRDVRRKRGDSFKWVYVIEHRHGAGRWHVHMIIDASRGWKLDLEEMSSLWDYGSVQLSYLFSGKYFKNSWKDLSSYLTKERPENDPNKPPVGTHSYHCSRGLHPPIVIHDWVDYNDHYIPPAKAIVDRDEVKYLYGAKFRHLVFEMPN